MDGRNEEIEWMGIEAKNDQNKKQKKRGFCQDVWAFETLFVSVVGLGHRVGARTLHVGAAFRQPHGSTF